MKITKELEAEIRTMMDDYWGSYFRGDLEHWQSYLVDDYRNIGGTEEEIWNSKQEIVEYTHRVIDQMAGLTELRNMQRQIIPYDGYLMVHEFMDIFIRIEEKWTFYGKFRLSSLIQKIADTWKVLHQHGSYPDSHTEQGEAFAFDTLRKENTQLREAVKRRTVELENKNHELKIEAAVERVRARAMAMHNSNELNEVVSVLFEKLKELQIPFTAVGIATRIEGSKDLNAFVCGDNADGLVITNYRLPYFDNPIPKDLHRALEKQLDFFVGHYSKEEKDAFYEYVIEHTAEFRHLPEDIKRMIFDSTTYTISMVAVKNAVFNINDFEGKVLAEHEVDIIKHFARVFDQAYTRFLDLQKAEAQAREAQIEAALERIRSKAIAMQNTDDIADTVITFFEELLGLGLDKTMRAGIGILSQEERMKFWTASVPDDSEVILHSGFLEMYRHPLLEGAKQAWADGDPYFNYILEGEDVNNYFQTLNEAPDFPAEFDLQNLPDTVHLRSYVFKDGLLYTFTETELPDDIRKTLERFAAVLGQTYTRYLDLQKAEEQAREAQIETALEKVRSRTMAMQHSDELIETSELMFEQIKNLDIELWSCGFSLWYDDDSYFMGYNTGPDGKMGDPLKIPLTEDVFFTTIRDAKRRGDDFLLFESEGESLAQTYRYMDTLPVVGEFMRGIVAAGAELPKYQVTHCGFFSHGHLMFIALEHNPEAIDIFKRFTKVFEQTYTRFLDLQKAEEQAREAKIETALEKIRSRTMAMQKGEELQEVAVLLYKELIALGVTNFVTCGYVEVNEDIRRQHTWVTAPGGDTMGLFHLPLTGDDTFDARYAAWKKQQPVFHQSVAGQVRSDHLEYAITTFNSKEAEEMVRSQFPDPTVFYCFNFSHGYLHIVGGSLLEKEEENLLARFTKVFEQTYTRFLDLQKAEEQAREARIEMSLEKIRSRTMGMQGSEELPEVANMLFLEVQELGIPAWSCGYCILTEDRRASTCIMSSEGTVQKPFLLPHTGEASFQEWDDFVHSDEIFFTQELGGEAIDSHYNFMKSLPQLKPVFQDLVDAGLSLPTYQINHLCKFSHGFLLFITYETVPEAHDIFKRFTRVFDQTYTRFLDLKKAEKQAREAQIENALEKVRSRSLAMQHPDELTEVAQLLREEMGALGVEELETSSIYIHDESSGLTECWFTIKNTEDPGKAVTDQMSIDLQNTWVGRQMHDFYRSPAKQISIVMQGENRVEWIRYCEEKSDLFGTSEFYGETIPERTYHLYKFSNGFLGAASPGNISDESWDLLKRATLVFSFAYTRFSDLQKAEESARRARQQASLDRVRADISGMRSADDLNQITPLIWNELNTLGVPFIRCGVFIIQEDDQQVEVYLSKPDGTSLAVMHLPFGSSELVSQTVDAWQQGSVYTQHWTREEFLEWGRSMMEQGQVSDLESYQGAEEAPESLHLQFLPFNQGMLYVGSTNPLDEEEISLSVSLAKAFSIAYARYEDFVKLEKAKAGIEDALAELKATQSQLVQQEKLASLGQLTAGIAHEIKNPLNFVNNFSEVSVELVDEAKEELSAFSDQLSAGDADKVKEALEILDDIGANLKKIHEHGSRADGIVKSMLMHSRGGDGKMEPTDINELVKEYVNLSYHGMRAGKDPIEVDIDLHLDESVGEVPLIAEDFSRVILNLCTNAFDACAQRGSSESLPQSPGGSFESPAAERQSSKSASLQTPPHHPHRQNQRHHHHRDRRQRPGHPRRYQRQNHAALLHH
jgi:signal transduction histidine kinase